MIRQFIHGSIFASVACTSQLSAQSKGQTPYAELRPDGNGIAALRSSITAGFGGSAAEALTAIAVSARLNLTYDPSLSALSRRVAIAATRRTAAQALMEVASVSLLRVRVSPQGQVVIDTVPAPEHVIRMPANSPAKRDTLEMAPVVLPGKEVKGERTELAAFKSTVNASTFNVS